MQIRKTKVGNEGIKKRGAQGERRLIKFQLGGGKISYSFRLILQFFEKTITDVEVSKIMKEVKVRQREIGE